MTAQACAIAALNVSTFKQDIHLIATSGKQHDAVYRPIHGCDC